MKKVLVVFLGIIFLASCSPSTAMPSGTPDIPIITTEPAPTSTPTPIPLSEIDLESILIKSGDLPAGYSPSQVRSTPPDMFDNIKNYSNSIYQQFELQGEAGGGVTVFLFDKTSQVSIAYQLIADGFGDSQDSESLKVEVDTLSGIGERATYVTLKSDLLGITNEFTDLVFTRCYAVVHIRLSDTAYLDYATGYGERLDKRLSEVECP